MSDLKEIVLENFKRYAGNVILDRAICDVRDMLKPAARMLMYSQEAITKNIPSKPFIKSPRVVGDCLGHFYNHGDGSCYSTYMRMAKPFAMRYPLEDCQGNSGTINVTNDEAASRYTELRLSALGYSLFDGIEKDTIKEWANNFDETEQYPKVLCSKGFYNIVNGSTGIGVSLSASIPQFNLIDINNAMIELINNPNYEINILPDFATGAILLNSEEVLESLRNGQGAACKLRAVIEYDEKERCFVVKELPYGVYADTITEQIQKLLEKDPNCGIESINNSSGKVVDYYIYLTKNANPSKILKMLYKETSLQSFYSINMTVLVDGKYPRVLGLKDMLLAHINHEKEVYRRSFEFDLRKINARLHILDGLLIALARIEEVVQTIKTSNSTIEANQKLQKEFLLDEEQATAILKITLARLAHLEVEKLLKEKSELETEKTHIEKILNSEELLNQELIKGWQEVAKKFGDKRRTQILNLASDGEDEIIEEKNLQLYLTNLNNFYVVESSSLLSQRRGGVGFKIKGLKKNEFIIGSASVKTNEKLLFFTKNGYYLNYKVNSLPLEQLTPLSSLIPIGDEIVCAVAAYKNQDSSITFITKKGLIKKSNFSEYNTSLAKPMKALNLDEGDEICSIVFEENEKKRLGILTSNGKFCIIDLQNVKAIGRLSRGVIGIKLDEDSFVAAAHLIPPTASQIIAVSQKGYIKRTPIEEFATQGRGGKGAILQKLNSNDFSSDFFPLCSEKEIIINSNFSLIKIQITEIPEQSRNTIGVRSLKLNEGTNVISIN